MKHININQRNGVNYCMPLPFKSCDKPMVPNNKSVAITRLNKLKQRVLKDEEYFTRYAICMDKLLEQNMQKEYQFLN